MGKRGPQPTPTATLAARKSWRANQEKRKNEVQPVALSIVPDPPAWLTEAGAVEFRRIAPEIHPSGLLTVADIDALGAYAERLSQYVELRAAAELEPMTFENEGMIRAHPVHKMRDEAAADCVRLRRELGMSPSGRVGITTEKPAKHKIGEVIPKSKGFAT